MRRARQGFYDAIFAPRTPVWRRMPAGAFPLGLICRLDSQATNKLLLVNYPFYTHWAPTIFGEFLLMGAVLGLVYRE